MALLNKLAEYFIEIFIIFLSTLIIVFGYPILFVILLTFWIYKQWAVKQAQKDPKIGKVLDGIDGVFAGQDPYSDPLIVLVPYIPLGDKLTFSTVVTILKEKVIAPNLYPELTQKIVRKYGYHFWYSIDNFKVENHVRYLKPECPNMPVTRTELRDMLNNKLGKLPFDSTTSPWEILVVPHVIDDQNPETKSVFALRVNHCLMDGYSINNFLKKFASKPWKTLGDKTHEKRQIYTNNFVDIYKILTLLFLGPYYLLKMFLFTNDHHQFVQKTYRTDFEETFNSQCTPAISESRLKSVKNAYRVTMSSLIATLLGQSTWRSMKRARIPIRNTIHGLLTYPLPGHNDVLSNHWSLVRIPIKVDEADPRKTLEFVEKEFQSLRNSVKPLVFFYATKLMTLIPLWLRMNSKYITPTSFLLSNFPGPTEHCDIFGCSMKQISLGGKPSKGISFFHWSCSLAGKFWLDSAGPICNLQSQQDADFLSESNMDTLAYLEARIPAN